MTLTNTQLDAELAVKVMGWTLLGSDWYCGNVYTGYDQHGFKPTTDAAHAMKVLEKCLEKCASIHHTIDMQKGGGKEPYCIRSLDYFSQADNFTHSAEAETLPMAISLFAFEMYKD